MRKQTWILLVEEEKGACDALRDLIFQLGYQVLSCSECARAHWYLQNQKFACVIIDHEVSGASGLSVVSTVKKNVNHVNNKTPFILMSEGLEAEFVSQLSGRLAGALVKPFEDSQFIEKVKHAVGAKI